MKTLKTDKGKKVSVNSGIYDYVKLCNLCGQSNVIIKIKDKHYLINTNQ